MKAGSDKSARAAQRGSPSAGKAKVKAKSKTPTVNHRTVVGRRRRAKMEAKILAAALRVFAEKGRDAPVIDDFIKAAGIARGTFYNYYKSTVELLEATSKWLSEDMQNAIHDEVLDIPDPALRHCTALRLWMRRAEHEPAWCAFVARIWFIESPLAAKDIRAGIKAGKFDVPSLHSAEDLSMGAIRQAMLRLLLEPDLKGYGEIIVRQIMQGLGVEANKIDKMMAIPLPELHRKPHSAQ